VQQTTFRHVGVFHSSVIESRTIPDAPPAPDPLAAAFDEHAVTLLRLCLLLTGRLEVAEDIVQDAFVRLAPKLARLEPDAVGPYLRRIAINLWKNRLRGPAAEIKARARIGGQARTEDTPPERRDEVVDAVRGLPPRQRACVVLRYYVDLPEREVEAALGCSLGTVKSQTSKALATLRRELRDEQ